VGTRSGTTKGLNIDNDSNGNSEFTALNLCLCKQKLFSGWIYSRRWGNLVQSKYSILQGKTCAK